MKRSAKIITAVVVITSVVGIATFGIVKSRQNESTDGIPRNAPSVQVEKAHRETIVSKVSANGKVDFVEKSTIYASTSAKVMGMNVKVGDAVTEGQSLFSYDPEALKTLNKSLEDAKMAVRSAEINLKNAKTPASETEILQAKTSVTSAQKTINDLNGQLDQTSIALEQLNRNIERAKETYQKAKNLYEQGVSSKNEMDTALEALTKLEEQLKTTQSQQASLFGSLSTAESSLALAEKQQQTVVNRTSDEKIKNSIALQQLSLEQAQSNVKKIQDDINEFKKEEIATVSGTILSVAVTDGQTVAKGTPLFVVGDVSLSNLVIVDYIPENESKDIALGQKVEITGGALGTKIYNGEVTKIFPMATLEQIGNKQEPAVTVEIKPTDTSIPLKAGYSLDTRIITKTSENVVVVPLMSIVSESGNKNYVFIVKPDNTLEKRAINMLTYSNLYVEVDNISEEDNIVLNPASTLKEGDIVRISLY